MIYPDVQSWKLTSNFPLTRVGTTGLKLPFKVKRPDGVHVLIPELSVFVDLPPELKGSHMSRNIEIVSAVRRSDEEFSSLEDICEKVSALLLEKHEYAQSSEVTMKADYFLDRTSPEGRVSTEHYVLVAEAVSRWGEGKTLETTKLIGVEVTGMTACPCGMETTRAIYMGGKEGDGNNCPSVTHNQRNVSKLFVETPAGVSIEANELITIVEAALSSPSFGILKRRDEAAVIWNAHNNPKFVEDVVRDILAGVVRRYQELPNEAVVTASSTSFESIHKHDAFAESVIKMKELRAIYLQGQEQD